MKQFSRLFLLLVVTFVFSGAMTSLIAQPDLIQRYETIEEEVFGQKVSKEVGIPYVNTVHYYGYIMPGVEPDAEINGKKAYFLYLWVPLAIDELAVRMISPVGDIGEPEDEDFVSDTYEKGIDEDDEAWFDTWVRVERIDQLELGVFDFEFKKEFITNFGEDDDGDDTFDEDRHAKYNSLLRIKSDVDHPEKSLVRGIYRITFTTYKTGEVKGSFLASIGTNIPGCIIAESLEKLDKLVDGE